MLRRLLSCTVTAVALAAQQEGLIRYARGKIEILDRAGMERGACECRATVQHLRQQLEPKSVLAHQPPDNGGR